MSLKPNRKVPAVSVPRRLGQNYSEERLYIVMWLRVARPIFEMF